VSPDELPFADWRVRPTKLFDYLDGSAKRGSWHVSYLDRAAWWSGATREDCERWLAAARLNELRHQEVLALYRENPELRDEVDRRLRARGIAVPERKP
jgi:hypothetical protein